MRSANPPGPARVPDLVFGVALLAVALSAPAADVPDAVIERWEQRWSFARDGSLTYHELKHARLNHERAYGEFADPKITFNKDLDQVEVRVARTKLPDGKYMDVPTYSRNEVALPGSAGWPAFASLRQLVLTMSGIQPGCVVELEYALTRKPGSFAPELGHELRLDHRYPIQERVVELWAGERIPLNWAISGPAPVGEARPERKSDEGSQRLTWRWKNIPAAINEPQAPPWQTFSPRLVFSTARSGDDAIGAMLARVEKAATPDESIRKAVSKWLTDVSGPMDRLEALREKLAATFSIVEVDAMLMPAELRPASEVFRSAYGSPGEATAVLLALARAAELSAEPAILLNIETSLSDSGEFVAPAAYAVQLTGREDAAFSVGAGRIARSARWAGCELVTRSGDGVSRISVPAWETADQSGMTCRGRVALAADGMLTGKLTVELRGFPAAGDFRTADRQRSRLQTIVERVLPEAQVASVAVMMLTDSAFVATAELKSARPLAATDGVYRLALAQDDPLLGELALPLAHEGRRLPVRLAGACSEQIDLTIEWPERWTVEAQPADLPSQGGDGPLAYQKVETATGQLRLSRGVTFPARDLALGGIRGPLNLLRSERWRTLILRPVGDQKAE